jgi:hypothetical protein
MMAAIGSGRDAVRGRVAAAMDDKPEENMICVCKRSLVEALFLLALAAATPLQTLLNGQTPSAYSAPALGSFDPKDIIRTLKLLRSPEYAAVAPAILPLLNHESANVVRDSCRTLAVIAGKEVVASIEPLLADKRANVRKDAQDAIAILRAKP